MIRKHTRSSTRRSRTIVVIVSSAVWLGAAAQQVAAANTVATWNGPAGLGGTGNWTDATSWSTGVVPTNGATKYDVDIDGGKAAASTVNLSGSFQIDNLTVDAGDTLNLANSSALTVSADGTAASVTDNGLINFNSSGNNTDLIVAANTAFNGTGTFQLSNNFSNRIYANSNQTLTIGSGETIQGSGQIGVGQTTFVNNGIIDANSSVGLTINPGAGGFTNNNLLEASGAVLTLEGSYTNTAATIEALTGGEVKLTGATVTGGILSSTGTGFIDFASSDTLNNVTINGNSTQENGVAVTVTGGALANNGIYSMNSSGNSTDLIVTANTALNGTGTFQLSNNVNNRIYANSNQTLTIGSGQTIQGAGQIGAGQTTIVNNGIIDANSSAGMTINPGSGGFTNNNLIEANGALVTMIGSFTNTTTIEALNSSEVKFTGATVAGGILKAAGTGFIDFSSSNTLSNVTINGNATQENGATTIVAGGSLTNNSIYSMNSSGNTTDVIVTANTAFNGTGTFQLSNSVDNRIYANSNQTLTIGGGETIQGAGQVGVDLTVLVNNGVIDANSSAGLTISVSGTASTNNNLFEAQNGSTLTLIGTYANAGSGSIQAMDTAAIALSSATISNNSITGTATGKITSSANSALNNLTVNGPLVNSSGTLALNNVILNGNFTGSNGAVTDASGTVTNNGIFTLNSTGSNTDFVVTANDTLLNGTGTVQLSNNFSNRIYANSNLTLGIGSGETIQGAGQIGVGQTTIVNNGVIDSSSSVGITIDPGGGGFTNDNLLEASGAVLTLGGFYTNTAGTIEALTGGEVKLTGATVTGGILSSTGTGFIDFASSDTLNNVTINGNSTQENGVSVTVTGSLANNGIYSMNSSGNSTDLIVTANTALNGTGTFQLSNNVNNRIYANSNQTLTIGSGQTIQGAGQIGVGQTTIVNNGIIDSNSSAGMTISPGATGVTNNNLVEATAGSTLHLLGTMANSATVSTDSASTIVMGGVFNNESGGNITNPGSITDTGTLTSGAGSTVSNSGAFKVDLGGTATISTGLSGGGNVTVGDPSGGVSHLTVSSITQNSLLVDVTGRMMISNNASTTSNTLNSLTINSGGALDLSNNELLINYGTGPDPAATIRSYLTTGYANGAWTGPGIDSSTAALPANNAHFGVGYADGADGVVAGLPSGQVEITYALYGDANLDGIVNGDDFTILVGNLGKSVTRWDQGDFNYDGVVNGDDFTLLVGNLGKQNTGAAVVLPASDYAAIDAFAAANGLMADVPEPATLSLLAVTAAGVLMRRRRTVWHLDSAAF